MEWAKRLEEKGKRLFEERVMSRPLPQRLRRWVWGPIPEQDRHKHLSVVAGERRVQRLITLAFVATLVVWVCAPIYELSEDQIRRGSLIVGAIATAVLLRSFFILRNAFHQPSRAHEYIPPEPPAIDSDASPDGVG